MLQARDLARAKGAGKAARSGKAGRGRGKGKGRSAAASPPAKGERHKCTGAAAGPVCSIAVLR